MTAGTTGAVILLVDDHRVFADVLREALLEQDGIDRVTHAASLAAARVLLATDPPDVVLLDLVLADESGFDLLSELTRSTAAPAAIVLSGSSDPRLIVKALERGAKGWLSKTTRLDALVTAVWQVLDGQMYLAPSTLRPVLTHLLSDAREREAAAGFVADLTPRELEVLRCLVSGMTRGEVAQHLFVSMNTVRTHVQSLLRSSGQHSALALVAFARSHGVQGIDETGDLPAAGRAESSY
ncbi:LuxR family two component transcriptional regulator [Kribbella voronezhensis]|uniref:LuxR family two component transcriptional regulator n=1 Tax=Kribbella voronezhensis TaxID=2512212 RepID=A0A4V3FIW2_9ACTN|nr:response regulator transcription factor [Kribbella voronezhensis]TDU83943.1 LuxR family two component transcriptional regulator [Kribbella voronezhensis]